jgi:oxygen-dependent protoporphyrinogen oxidase
MQEYQDIVIIGGGISGLSTLAFLNKQGQKALLLEKQDQPGGVMRSETNEKAILDFGSNSAIEKNMAVPELIEYMKLQNEVMYASRASSKRYILRYNKLHALQGPISIVFGKLFTWKGKFRVIKEIWIKPRMSQEDESVASFVERRLGREIVDYAFSPLISGIYAGRPEEVSMKANYPKMTALEQNYGSIIRGAVGKAFEKIKDKAPKEPKPSKNIFSFKNGMQQFARTIAERFDNQTEFNIDVQAIKKLDDGKFLITYLQNSEKRTIIAKKIISTAPAHIAKNYFSNLSEDLSKALEKIYYPPVAVLNLVYNRTDIQQALDSFGFLIPEKEQKAFLGAVWSSVVFPNRTDEKTAAFTLFVGGSINKTIADNMEESLFKAKQQFAEIMGIKAEPIIEQHKLWEKAIPQYNMDYPGIISEIEKFETQEPNVIISGNYYKGFATGDCILNAKENALKMVS